MDNITCLCIAVKQYSSKWQMLNMLSSTGGQGDIPKTPSTPGAPSNRMSNNGFLSSFSSSHANSSTQGKEEGATTPASLMVKDACNSYACASFFTAPVTYTVYDMYTFYTADSANTIFILLFPLSIKYWANICNFATLC